MSFDAQEVLDIQSKVCAKSRSDHADTNNNVLYAEPEAKCKEIKEWQAADGILWYKNDLCICFYPIEDNLCIAYDIGCEKTYGDVTVIAGPVYVIKRDPSTGKALALTSKEYVTARNYIDSHRAIAVTENGNALRCFLFSGDRGNDNDI